VLTEPLTLVISLLYRSRLKFHARPIGTIDTSIHVIPELVYSRADGRDMDI
jgi:hypothetical protein